MCLDGKVRGMLRADLMLKKEPLNNMLQPGENTTISSDTLWQMVAVPALKGYQTQLCTRGEKGALFYSLQRDSLGRQTSFIWLGWYEKSTPDNRVFSAAAPKMTAKSPNLLKDEDIGSRILKPETTIIII